MECITLYNKFPKEIVDYISMYDCEHRVKMKRVLKELISTTKSWNLVWDYYRDVSNKTNYEDICLFHTISIR